MLQLCNYCIKSKDICSETPFNPLHIGGNVFYLFKTRRLWTPELKFQNKNSSYVILWWVWLLPDDWQSKIRIRTKSPFWQLKPLHTWAVMKEGSFRWVYILYGLIFRHENEVCWKNFMQSLSWPTKVIIIWPVKQSEFTCLWIYCLGERMMGFNLFFTLIFDDAYSFSHVWFRASFGNDWL